MEDLILVENIMRSLPIFAALDLPGVVKALAGRLRSVPCLAGQELLQRGDEGTTMYFVLRGALDMSVNDELVGAVKGGQCVGEAFMIGVEKIWPVTLTALAGSSVGCVSLAELTAAVAKDASGRTSRVYQALCDLAERYRGDPGQFGRIGLFGGLSPTAMSALEDHSLPRIYVPGQKILTEGEAGDDLYVLMSGRVSLEAGGKVVKAFDRAETNGPIGIGELGLLGFGRTRSATVTAESVCFMKVLPRMLFLGLLRELSESVNLARVDELMRSRYSSDAFAKSAVTSIKLFKAAGCSQEFVDYLVTQLEDRMFVADQTILEGARDDWRMYIVQYGTIHVTRGNMTVESLGEGEAFGEALVLGLQPVGLQAVKAVAAESCFLKCLHLQAVHRGLGLFPAQRAKVLAAACALRDSAGEKASGREGLKQAPFFTGMSPVLLDKLAAQASERVYLPGEVLFEEGSIGSSMHVLVFGRVGVWNRKSGSKSHPALPKDRCEWDKNLCTQVATLTPGAILGEMAMLGFSPARGATVEAEVLTSTLELTQQACFDIIGEFPDAQRRFSTIICERLEPTVQETLARMPIFEPFDRNLALLLGLSCERRIYFPGAKIARVSQQGDGMYIINRGQARLETSGITIKQCPPGSTFAAGIMLGVQRTNPCSLSALRMCHVLVITRETFTNSLRLYPSPESHEELRRSERLAIKELKAAVKRNEARQFQRMRSKGDFVKELLHHQGKIDEMLHASEEIVATQLLDVVLVAWREACGAARERRQRLDRRRLKRDEWIRQKQEALGRRHEKDLDRLCGAGLRAETPPGRDTWDRSPVVHLPPQGARGKRGEAFELSECRAPPKSLAPYHVDQKTGRRVTSKVRPLPALNFLDRWRAMVDELN